MHIRVNPGASGYGIPDYSPPAVQVKALWVARGVPHCSAKPIPSAMMDAYFDNVFVNAQ